MRLACSISHQISVCTCLLQLSMHVPQHLPASKGMSLNPRLHYRLLTLWEQTWEPCSAIIASMPCGDNCALPRVSTSLEQRFLARRKPHSSALAQKAP